MSLSTTNRKTLLSQIDINFNSDELRELNFTLLRLNYDDDIKGQTKRDKIISIIEYCERHQELEILLEYCRQERPKSNWNITLKNNSKDGRQPISRPYITKKIWVIVLFLLLGGILIAITLNSSFGLIGKPFTLDKFEYQVRVIDIDTGEPIKNAEVSIDVASQAPRTGLTDTQGTVRIFIDSTLNSSYGRLRVQASDYEVYTKEIDLVPEALPLIISLKQKS